MNALAGARSTAMDALMSIETGSKANEALARALAGTTLERRDRNLATELVYGTCRMRRACDWLLAPYLRDAEALDVDTRVALRLGVYQLCWTRVPQHAAVSETVGLLPRSRRPLVNAVLRRASGDLAGREPTWPDLATELSYPDWIVRRLERDLGREGVRQALVAMNQSSPQTVRSDGYAQDPASLWVAESVGVSPGEVVLDLCAAPGGKATALASATPALVAAVDIELHRCGILAANADRLGASRVAVIAADGTASPFAERCFDRVLVDAPCSGLGALRRRPDARWRSRPPDIERLAALQKRLLSAAERLVKRGGLVAYSVCTLTRAETTDVDRWLAAEYPGLQAVPPPGAPWEPAGRGALLLPQAAGTDGMFLLLLRST